MEIIKTLEGKMKRKEKKIILTGEMLFNKVIERMKEKGTMHTGLDYYRVADDATQKELYDFSSLQLLASPQYGNSEGIYLDLYLRGKIGLENAFQQVNFATFKTLADKEEDMYEMCRFLASFQIAMTDFLFENGDDYAKCGFHVRFFSEDGEEKYAYYCGDGMIRSLDDIRDWRRAIYRSELEQAENYHAAEIWSDLTGELLERIEK